MSVGRGGRVLVRMLSGLVLAASLVGASLLFRHYTGGFRSFAALVGMLGVRNWAVLAALTAGFYLADYARLRFLLAIFRIRLPLGTGLALCAASYFAASLTPSAELHAPIMVLLMTRVGVPASTAMAVTLAKSLFMTAWVMAVSFLASNLGHEVVLPSQIGDHLGLWQLPLLGGLLLLLVVIVFPERVQRAVERRLTGRSPRWLRRVLGGVTATTRQLSTIGTSTDLGHFGCHLASLVEIGLYVAIGAYLAASLGVPLSAGKAVTVFSDGMLVAYVAPIPGAVGVTEMTTSYLLDPELTRTASAVAILQRTLCWYGAAAVGAVVVAQVVRKVGLRALVNR